MVSTPIPSVVTQPAARDASIRHAASQALQYWHLLSLDAPTVAVVWTIALARAAGVTLPLLAPFLLAIATWLLYVADRLLDGRRLSTAGGLQERHYFHHRHRFVFLAVAIPLLMLLTWLVVYRMEPAPRSEDLLLALAAGLYLLLVHLSPFSRHSSPGRIRRFSSKEAAVGIIFAAACVIPALARHPLASYWLLATGMLFAALCWLNCLLIDQWESSSLRAAVHPSLRASGRWLCTVALAAALLSAGRHHPLYAVLDLCVLLSTTLLLVLDHQRYKLAPVPLRACADAVLLTPILLLLLLHP